MDKIFAERRKAQLVQEGREDLVKGMDERAKEKPVHRTDLPMEEPPEFAVARDILRENELDRVRTLREAISRVDDMVLQAREEILSPTQRDTEQDEFNLALAMAFQDREQALLDATQDLVNARPNYYAALASLVSRSLRGKS